MMHFWRAAERRFKHPCGVGLGWFVTNGAVTGDGHSVWVLNLMMAAWARFEKANQPQSQPRAFADDSGVLLQVREDPAANLGPSVPEELGKVAEKRVLELVRKTWMRFDAFADCIGSAVL